MIAAKTETVRVMSVATSPIPWAVYMTLRDYFAAQAMQSVMANFARAEYDDVARHSYQLADEMMKARGEKSG